MLSKIKQFIARDEGATAIEYGLIAALVAVAIIGALTALGVDLTAIFTGVSSELQQATP